ncbi:sterol-sensing domain of SREBP cleavage-activation-domain-containing protein [Geopyxis carbonaria]|nr:sterol-sensing domain of SREBP cleavage-activation-domain-containing protein [Geopyxis carbonaria]
MAPGSFFHSPLLYWNCSLSTLETDPDIIGTVNDNISRRSPAKVGLRWGSVFAGKQFSHQKLVAADALVISLFYNLNSSAGALWDHRAAKLAQEAHAHGRFIMYPSDGHEKGSILYEFRYEPMSVMQKLFLTGCYACAAIYLFVSLRRLRAVKSRLGLVATVLTQICTSVLSSFTILAIFKVPVSHVPRYVWIFPFVIVVIGLESMFRLINAVLATPAEQSTTARISSALGEVGLVSFVGMATNLFMLFVIGTVSVPAIREFCVFAGVALITDYTLHMTFFLAVLSVDVRRLELQDSLDRLNLSTNDDESLEPNISRGNLFRGGSPLSTRIAGSVIMMCFAAALNMHFLDNQHPLVTLNVLGDMIRNPKTIGQRSLSQVSEMPLNVARTPTAWMRSQDQLTGMELIRAVKPGNIRVIARAYNPLFFVLAESNRARTPEKMPNILSTLELDIIRDHFQSFILSVAIVVAAVIVLMNYLLLTDIPMEEPTQPKVEVSLLTCQTLIEGHSLDVAILAASPSGILVSVGLDRRIVVWKLNGNRQLCVKHVIRPSCTEHILWPVMALAADEKGEWLAVASRSGQISFYKLDQATLHRSVHVEMQSHQPSAFFFAPRHDDQHHGPRLMILCSDGRLFEIYVRTAEIVKHRICEGIVVSSSHGVFTPRLPLRIVTACQRGRIFVTAKSGGDWYTEQLNLMAPPLTSPILEPGEPCTILPLSALGMVISSRSCNVELVDILSGSIIRSFQTGQFKPSTLRAFHGKRRTCLYCGCPSVLSFSIVYSERESGMFMMHTFSSSKGKMRDICLRAERDRREKKCAGFENVIETTHWLENVEGWEVTNLNMVIGIRRRELSQEDTSSDDYESPCQNSSLRRRKKMAKKATTDEEDEWEAWAMDAGGIVTSYPLRDPRDSDFSDDGLMVSHAGPVTKVGQRSVAIGFGNTVKVLYVGNERFEDEDGADPYRTLPRKHRNHRR